ncbi:hypothetical protein BaRGS_00009514, partial [Batillaria attramentaria]
MLAVSQSGPRAGRKKATNKKPLLLWDTGTFAIDSSELIPLSHFVSRQLILSGPRAGKTFLCGTGTFVYSSVLGPSSHFITTDSLCIDLRTEGRGLGFFVVWLAGRKEAVKGGGGGRRAGPGEIEWVGKVGGLSVLDVLYTGKQMELGWNLSPRIPAPGYSSGIAFLPRGFAVKAANSHFGQSFGTGPDGYAL